MKFNIKRLIFYVLTCTYFIFINNISSFAEGLEKNLNGIYYYYNDGTYHIGWKTIANQKYYFKKDGRAVNENTTINGIRYKFNKDGIYTGGYTGWTIKKANKFYYKNGIMQKGWISIKENTYYFLNNGVMKTGELITTNKSGELKIYCFNNKGIWDGKEKEYNILNYKPKTLGDFIYGRDFGVSYKIEIKYKNKFKIFNDVDYILSALEPYKDKTFVYGKTLSDLIESPANIYDDLSGEIMIRFRNEKNISIGFFHFSKDKDNNGYFYSRFLNCGIELNDSAIFDELVKIYYNKK